MCEPRQNEEAVWHTTSGEVAEGERHLREMELLVTNLRLRQERRIAMYGPHDPLVLEVAARMPVFEQALDEARRDQARRLDRLD